jgi:hypothetical protein
MKKKNMLFMTGSLFLMSYFASCDKKDEPSPASSGEAAYVYSTIVGDNSYVGVFDDFESVSSLNNSNSFVHTRSALLFPYKDYLYVLEFETNEKLFQYRKSDGDLQLVKTLSLPAQSYPCHLSFKNDGEAYLSFLGMDRVAVINTQTLVISSEIDLSSYHLDNAIASPGASIIRDNLLYVALWQQLAPSYPSAGAYVAIINTETNQPVKMISSQRATMASSVDAAGDPFVDEKGDIYLYCTGGFGYFPDMTDGFLRIKKGETEFDNTYYFPIGDKNIAGIPGNHADYLYQKVYAGNGKVYGYVNVPAAASEIPDYVNDKTMQPVILDIYNQTIERLNLDPTTGWSSCIGSSGNKLVWGMMSSEGAGFYLYDSSTGQTDKFVATTGSPYRFFEFNNQ